jgi:hypothetical protein
MSDQLNPEFAELLKIARQRNAVLAEAEKTGFVDPAMAGGMPPGGAPPAGGADPMAGAMPPMPGMGMDPAAAGGMPADPAAGLTEERVMQMIQEAGAGGGAAGAVGPDGAAKKKVDVNTEIYHIKKLLIHLLDTLGVEVPPTMMLGDPAEDPQATPEQVAADPASAGASPQSAIAPIQALQGASPDMAAAAGGGGDAPSPKTASVSGGGHGLLGVAGQAAAYKRVLQTADG